MKMLEAQGDQLSLHKKEKPMDPWVARSIMSVAGQSLQIVSAMSRVGPSKNKPGTFERKPIDMSFFMFAALNMAANGMNFIFGSQKTEDEHQLKYLKEQFSNKLDSHLPEGEQPIDPKDKREQLHREPPEPKTAWDKTYDFLQRNSVTVGEIGLRYAAALGLVFPMIKQGNMIGWKEMAKLAFKGELKQAVKQGVTGNKTQLWAGGLYLFGKTIALASQVKDPYDPKPHTMMDTIREEGIFKLGSIIEAGAGSLVAYNAYSNNKIGFGKELKPMTDWAGTVGGALFATGYGIRFFAKYGEKKMNMDELYAHISDNLAKVPPEQLPQLIAESAAAIKDHFKDKPLEFGKIYNQMMTDLYKYHHIALDNLGTEPNERAEKLAAKCAEQGLNTPAVAAADTAHEHKPATRAEGHKSEDHKHEHKHADKHQRKSTTELASVVPAASHVEKAAAKSASEPHHSLGA